LAALLMNYTSYLYTLNKPFERPTC
jgi:hypothetical protein